MNNFIVVPSATDIEEIYGTEKNIIKASYLPQFMASTVSLTSTFSKVRVIENKFL